MSGCACPVQLWDNRVKALLMARAVKGATGRASVLVSILFSNVEGEELTHSCCSIPFLRAVLQMTGTGLGAEHVLCSSRSDVGWMNTAVYGVCLHLSQGHPGFPLAREKEILL